MSEKKKYLLSGKDPGNSDFKISFLNTQGDVEDFSIPTCIAPAPSEKELNVKRTKADFTDFLHVEVSSSNQIFPRSFHYVGTSAKLSPQRKEPKENEDKATSDVHLITMIVGEALAALRNGINDHVYIRPSVGLPIEDVKAKKSALFLGRLKGSFTVRFIDGLYSGETITIHHEIDDNRPVDDYIHPEAIKTTLGLSFDVKKYELMQNDVASLMVEDIVLSDAGGKTFDIAVYEEGELNGSASVTYKNTPVQFETVEDAKTLVGKPIGANHYIDTIHEKVVEKLKEEVNKNKIPLFEVEFFRGRNDVINKLLKPYIKSLEDMYKNEKENKVKKDQPRITYDLMGISVDLTDTVKPILDEYGKIIYYMNLFARQENGASSIKNNILVGGGVLLAYGTLKELQYTGAESKIKLYDFPSDIFSAPFSNARGYLYNSLVVNEDILNQLKENETTA